MKTKKKCKICGYPIKKNKKYCKWCEYGMFLIDLIKENMKSNKNKN